MVAFCPPCVFVVFALVCRSICVSRSQKPKPVLKAMTVSGLWQLLKRRGLVHEVCGTEARDLLEGKRIAIDVSCWVVHGEALESTLAARSVSTRCQHFLATSFWRIARYLRVGAFPLAVVEGACPATKRRRRKRYGDFQRNLDHIAKLFRAMGCPVVQAKGEAEECCAKLSKAVVVQAIESPDSDVFPFGATRCVLKAIDNDAACAWHLELVDIEEASSSIGLGPEGWIALAALSGCDFLPTGARGIGAEKALQCVRGVL